jgi:cytolysin-activating lysine-acyltransferase
VSTTTAEAASAKLSNGAGAAPAAIDTGKTAAAAGKAGAKPTVSHILGELTWLLSQSPAHKHFAIGDLEWLVMPAILLEQFRVFHGPKHPLGFALWAEFSEEAEKRFLEQIDAGRGARLMPQDWKSGDRLWLIELVAPFATPENKLQEAMLADLVENVFKGRKFKLHVIDPAAGKREMKEVER